MNPAAGRQPTVGRPPHLVLVDGSGYLFRAFHALPPMTRSDGTPVNAVFGYTNMLAKLLRDHVGTHLAVIFDAGRKTFRNRLYQDYKAHRPDPPPELLPQFGLVREATAAFGVPAVELEDWEADDLIASYARAVVEAGGTATIVSSDKDLMQLIRPGVDMLDPIKQKPIGAAEVVEKFGVPPEKMIDAQSLIGDSVDNVPGIPGIGPKTAAQLIQEFGDLDTILAAAPAMKPSKRRDMLLEHAENARISRTLVTLHDDAPLPTPLDALAVREPERETLASWLREQGFRSTLLRLGLEEQTPSPTPTNPVPAAKPGAQQQGHLGLETPSQPATASEPKPAEGGQPAFGPYETITTIGALQAWIAEATTAGIVALDTETDALNPMRAELIGFSLATAAGRAAYVPVAHDGLAEQISPAVAVAALAPLLHDPSVLKIFHNAKFDLIVLERAGAPVATPLDDSQVVQYLPLIFPGYSYDIGNRITPVYFNGTVYVCPGGNALKAFAISNALLATTPTRHSSNTFGYSGAVLSISSNGNADGVVWAMDHTSGTLFAYDATNVTNPIYTSAQASGGRDTFSAVGGHFNTPTVVDGKVYFGTSSSLVVFGLLP